MTHVIRSDAQANRARVVLAARSVFAEQGLAADMKTIAQQANVGVGTIYRNFATKDELLQAVMEACIADAYRDLLDLRAVHEGRERLAALARTAFLHAERNGPLFAAIGAAGTPPSIDPPPEILEIITAIFSEAAADGDLRADIPAAFLARFLATLFPAYLELRQSFPAELVTGHLTELFLSAVSPTAVA